MDTVVIGAGFTGIAAAWELSQSGHNVTVLEYSHQPGGLAAGFKAKGWRWPLEYHYHHIFASDNAILKLIEDMGLTHLVSFSTTLTGVLRNNRISPIDSPVTLMRLPFIPFIDKCRIGVTLAFLKITNRWQMLEKVTASSFLTRTMGKRGYEELWKPLLVGKFGRYADKINAAWFWARIKARTKKLGYFDHGFAGMAEAMISVLKKNGVTIAYGSQVEKIAEDPSGKVVIRYSQNGKTLKLLADQALVTLPATQVTKLVNSLPQSLHAKLSKLTSLGAITVVFELEGPLFKKGWYWLNINDPKPFLAVVEHTNFVDAKHYGNKSIVYVGKYLSPTDPLYASNDEKIVQLFTEHLSTIPETNPLTISRSWVNRAPFAQPIAPINQSMNLPPHVISPGKIYWTSMQHIYPWDRGTNFAVGAGVSIVQKMNEDLRTQAS